MTSNPSPDSGDDKLLTAEEVAKRLRSTPLRVMRACRAGEIPASKPFGTWLIKDSTVEAILAATSNQAVA